VLVTGVSERKRSLRDANARRSYDVQRFMDSSSIGYSPRLSRGEYPIDDESEALCVGCSCVSVAAAPLADARSTTHTSCSSGPPLVVLANRLRLLASLNLHGVGR